VKCIGAFRAFDCPNEADAILCDSCWRIVSTVLDRTKAVPVRFSPRPRHGRAVRLQVKGDVA
jgi:hypothetical protein